MSTFPGSPRLIKGAIVTLQAPSYNQIESTIAFQYNPDSLSRSLNAEATKESAGAPSPETLLNRTPRETINLKVVIDAIDQLEKGDRTALELGIYPQLSALEVLMYPKSDLVKAANQRTQQGVLEINPLAAPVTLLIWGDKRVLPVRLTGFTVDEAYHDIRLNPIRAEVSLNLQVLTYSDVPWEEQRAKLFFAHQVSKERMAAKANISNVREITGVNVAGRLRG
ncbi:hypothetical protein [Leptolyngbya sp. AN10]|uniref:CIS tube protein n=1 Tax=Leptolyngbya sp. AN10 TaxID=3423365 RepID=UPI003D310A74